MSEYLWPSKKLAPSEDELEECYFLDLNLECETEVPGLERLLDEFLVAKNAQRVRRPPYSSALKLLILNLIQSVREGEEYIAVSKDNNLYAMKRYYTGVVRGPGMKQLLEWLAHRGYIQDLGWYNDRKRGKARRTRIRANRKLLDLVLVGAEELRIVRRPRELIVLKDTEKQLIDYKDNRDTRKWRGELERYNALLERTKVELDGVALPLQAYHRVFNDGRWSLGGRLYGASVQGLSAKDENPERKRLVIDGEACVELDFAGLHPRLLYTGSYGDDPYDLPGFAREDVKFLSSRVLNTKSRSWVGRLCLEEAVRALKNEKDKRKFTNTDKGEVERLLVAFEEKHRRIKEHFYECPATRLQFIDSTIALKVINHFVALGYPILAVHDSFIVQERHRELLNVQMYAAYKAVTGKDDCKIKGPGTVGSQTEAA